MTHPCPHCSGTGFDRAVLDDPCDPCAGEGTDPDRTIDVECVFEGQSRWVATFDTYDGAPDSNHPIGWGRTRQEAIDKLIEAEADQ